MVLSLALLTLMDYSRVFKFLSYHISRLKNTIAIQTSGGKSKLKECLIFVHLAGHKVKIAQKSLFWVVQMESYFKMNS